MQTSSVVIPKQIPHTLVENFNNFLKFRFGTGFLNSEYFSTNNIIINKSNYSRNVKFEFKKLPWA
jgi:hypothetical protein